MKRVKQNYGITLVALVITIIILLILAGVTIVQLTGNGLFSKSKQAENENQIAADIEEIKLKHFEYMTIKESKDNSELFLEFLGNNETGNREGKFVVEYLDEANHQEAYVTIEDRKYLVKVIEDTLDIQYMGENEQQVLLDEKQPELEVNFDADTLKISVNVQDSESGLKNVIINKLTSETFTGDIGKTEIFNKNYESIKEIQTIECLVNFSNEYLRGYEVIAIDNAGNEKKEENTSLSIQGIAVTSVSISRTSQEIIRGDDYVLTVTISPSNATNKKLICSSSDENIATVDENGKVTGVAEGSCTITVQTEDGGYSKNCTFTVCEPQIEGVSLGAYVQYDFGEDNISLTSSQTGTSTQNYTTNYTGKWQVLYNDTQNGLQIISRDSIGTLNLYGKVGYNNLFKTLNLLANIYSNSDIAQSARSVGSLPTDTIDSADTTSIKESSVGALNSDSKYSADRTKLQRTNLEKTCKDYYLASRYSGSYLSSVNYKYSYGIYGYYSGSFDDKTLYSSPKTASDKSETVTNGVRAVITIKSNVSVTGEGTEEKPYVFTLNE